MEPVSGTRILNGQYSLLELIRPDDASKGTPMIWRVGDLGSVAVAKIWRDNAAQPELRSIWAHEVRNLLRLGGRPHADEVFVRLRELGIDPLGYVVVLDVEGREPLSQALRDRAHHPWLRDLRLPRTRQRLWEGLLRVARGLAIMHAEGTLHRMLGPDSVFTDLEGAGDFRLSGFEWSLRIASALADSKVETDYQVHLVQAPELVGNAAQYSVASDWFSFGVLAASVVAGISLPGATGDGTLGPIAKMVAKAPITPGEKRLVADLLDADPEKRMWHASDVTETISGIIDNLSVGRVSAQRPLYIGFNLSPGSDLSRLIVKASGGQAPAHDPGRQLDFIREDLGTEPQVSARIRPFPHYVLHGALINYQLSR